MIELNKTETRAVVGMGHDPKNANSIERFVLKEFINAPNQVMVEMLLGTTLDDVIKGIKKKQSKTRGKEIKGYKYLKGKSKIGIFAVYHDNTVAKYGDWISEATFLVIMNLETLPPMEQYVSKKAS